MRGIIDTMSKILIEQSSAPTKVGNRWRAVLITPGSGSTGVYSESVLSKYGAVAFPKGTHSYVDHPRSDEESRSAKNLIGTLAEDAYYEKGIGLVGEIDIMPHWKEFVEAVAPHTGLSIYAMGEGDEADSGEFEVTSLHANIQNSVDLVSYAGRPGSKLEAKLYEAAVSISAEKEISIEEEVLDSETSATPPIVVVSTINEEEGYSDMEIQELSDQIAALPQLIATAVVEAMAPVEEVEEKEEINVEAVAEALVAADLPQISRKAVYESIRAGVDITVAIESQKAYVDSVKAHLKEEAKSSPRAIEEALIINGGGKGETLSSIANIKVGA